MNVIPKYDVLKAIHIKINITLYFKTHQHRSHMKMYVPKCTIHHKWQFCQPCPLHLRVVNFACVITLPHPKVNYRQSNKSAGHCLFVGVLDRLVIHLQENKLKSRLFTLRVYISTSWQQTTARYTFLRLYYVYCVDQCWWRLTFKARVVYNTVYPIKSLNMTLKSPQ